MHPIKNTFWKTKRHFPTQVKDPPTPPPPLAPYLFAMMLNC